ncbi:MAG: hypothetical protein HY698_07750 [Deltaproteobacteria bacterium]|nr:hypothetical protein [Deltaproteobacteria bacterium]
MLLSLICGTALTLLPPVAAAVPRFAARTGMHCASCHVNPSGGGMRTPYGRNVYARRVLPLPGAGGFLAQTSGVGARVEADTASWFELGTDVRSAYFYVNNPDPRAEDTNSFFLMQGDLYVSARSGEHLTVYMDRGLHGSFEVFGLLAWPGQATIVPLASYLKVGRFLPAFGIKDPNHALVTRESIGFAQVDKDTGIEIGGYLGPWSLQLALLNGASGDRQLDASGTARRPFEKAVALRAESRSRVGHARLSMGGSFYFSDNLPSVNPLAPATAVAPRDVGRIGEGVHEIRTGAFGGLSLGRLTLQGEIDYVRDDFVAQGLERWHGYVSFAELSFLPVQGVDLLATYEFADPDLRVGRNGFHRVGGVVELFPMELVELRGQYRYTTSSAGPPRDGMHELIVYLHLFL